MSTSAVEQQMTKLSVSTKEESSAAQGEEKEKETAGAAKPEEGEEEEDEKEYHILSNILPNEEFFCILGDQCTLGDPKLKEGNRPI